MTGRYDTLQKINQNTFSIYVAPSRDLQQALVSGPVQTIHSPITYLFFGYDEPLLILPSHLKHRIYFRRIEGLAGLIGAMKKDDSGVLFIQYSRDHIEENESNIHFLAEECITHARHIAPVVILSVNHDHIIEQLGLLSDRYIILTDKTRKTIAGNKCAKQKTLHECISLPPSIHPLQPTKQYGQQSLWRSSQ
ncbi:hypothetical protein KSK55_00430 [Methanospirillum purgamenti]|jgi:hypothetical protein|uniref:Uncharacterized protein n=1 Tax=Methanospirillum hungatei TaxID=2203 RepID=A0A8F5VPV8_METHU|nr:hypothetical protein [Methanospirillum hungatei]QXO94923.1 hypothetical protein KSK55_00430 [Methanospirillum hungatei]